MFLNLSSGAARKNFWIWLQLDLLDLLEKKSTPFVVCDILLFIDVYRR